MKRSLFKDVAIITTWIMSCTTIEQLDLLLDVIRDLIKTSRYPENEPLDVVEAGIELVKAVDDSYNNIRPYEIEKTEI